MREIKCILTDLNMGSKHVRLNYSVCILICYISYVTNCLILILKLKIYIQQDVLNDVSICKWGFSENDVATGERLHDVSAIPGGQILTFVKHRAVLFVWPRLYMSRHPSVSTNTLVSDVRAGTCVPNHLWLTNDSRVFPAASLVPHEPLAHTERKITKERVDKCS